MNREVNREELKFLVGILIAMGMGLWMGTLVGETLTLTEYVHANDYIIYKGEVYFK